VRIFHFCPQAAQFVVVFGVYPSPLKVKDNFSQQLSFVFG